MNDASFELHRWHSSEPQLEDRPHSTPYEEQSYAKQQLQAQSSRSKLLGVKWNKEDDTITVHSPEVGSKPTKREVLAKLAKVYDPSVSSHQVYYKRNKSFVKFVILKLHGIRLSQRISECSFKDGKGNFHWYLSLAFLINAFFTRGVDRCLLFG